MQPSNQNVAEARRHPRLKLPAMYTLVRVKLPDKNRFTLTGHAYDVSLSGIRFELDEPLPFAQTITVRVMLPGSSRQTTFEAEGHVVRIHGENDDQFGPARMGLTFTKFSTLIDEQRLADYLGHNRLRAA